MTYDQIETDILAELNRTDIQAQVATWVDRVYRDVMSRYEFSWMKALAESPTEVGTYKYPVASDFYDSDIILLIDGDNSRELVEKLSNEFHADHPSIASDTTDRPEECSIISGISSAIVPYKELWVWPPPNAVYTLQMTYFITAPVMGSGMTPIIPAKYHAVLVQGGLKFGFARLREYDAATWWKGEYETTIAAMIREDKAMPNVQRVLQPFMPTRAPKANDHLSPFVRRMD